MNYITVSTPGHPYVFLSPRFTPPREESHIIRSADELQKYYHSLREADVVAIDFETNGVDPWRGPDHSYVVGVGLAWDGAAIYVDVASVGEDEYKKLINYLVDAEVPLIAHNAYFDGQFIFRDAGWRHPKWLACTYGLYMQLAGEGFLGQTWGLKNAQREILLWPESNEVELDAWLVENGYTSGPGKAAKGQMWRAPADILGKYCILDAESTYLLYVTQFKPHLDNFYALEEFHRTDFLNSVRLHIEQRFVGIEVDRPGMYEHSLHLLTEAAASTKQFLTHDTVKPLIEVWNEEQFQKYVEEHPEPALVKKDGSPSKNHAKWVERVEGIRDGRNDKYQFNPNSGAHLRWLFHDQLGIEVDELTDSGLPKMDKKVLGTSSFGELGKLLIHRNELLKENSYVESYISHTENSNTIHPSYRIPGTVTGRVSGKDPNILQAPKTKDVFKLFRAREGHKFLDLDFAALEPNVATELSQCPGMLRVYGPNARPNDIYLFVGGAVPGIREKLAAVGYDPDFPTPEAISIAKKELKRERSILKVLHLSAGYGAGVGKIWKTLQMSGVDISFAEVEKIYNSYWELFSGVKEYGERLKKEWRRNGGYVMSGLGIPIAVAEDLLKDVFNRVCQTTGHQILMRYNTIYTNELDRRGIPWSPIIIDWHDASTIEVPDEYVEEAAEVMGPWAVAKLNEELGGMIQLKGEVEIGIDLADVKKPES
jgi:DNA polymerase I-like protein with 3'-5' exonuclease and polymerase domains